VSVETAVVSEVVSAGRSPAIAWLRVLAILGVICIHVSSTVVVNEGLRGTPVYVVASVMNGATRFCVPLFVVVSGALVLKPSALRDGFGAYYRKRLTRLLPALIVWHLVYLVFRVVVLGRALGPVRLVGMLLTGQVYTALYFFWLLLGLYLVAPLLILAFERLTPRQRLLAALLLTATTCLWQSALGILAWVGEPAVSGTRNIVTMWVPYVGYFVLGWALRELTPSRRSGRWALLAVLVTAALLSLQTYGRVPRALDLLSPVNYWGWLVAVETLALFLAAAWFLRDGTWAARGWRATTGDTLGSLTLGVFAVHLIVLYFLARRLAPGFDDGHVSVVTLLGLAALVATLSWGIAWGMSRVPYLRRIV
jgi:surface polysaccharide O-acyltransferase-like enzyme